MAMGSFRTGLSRKPYPGVAWGQYPSPALCRACASLVDRALDQIAKLAALLLHAIFGVDAIDQTLGEFCAGALFKREFGLRDVLGLHLFDPAVDAAQTAGGALNQNAVHRRIPIDRLDRRLLRFLKLGALLVERGEFPGAELVQLLLENQNFGQRFTSLFHRLSRGKP